MATTTMPNPAKARRAAAAGDVLLFLFRMSLGLLFVVAGALKSRDPAGFATEIGNYRLLPELAPYLAIALPGIEIAAGAALVVGSRAWQRAGAAVIAAMMLAFTVAVTQVVVRGIDIRCGCFGVDSGAVTWLTVLRDVVLLAVAVLILVATSSQQDERVVQLDAVPRV